MYKIQCIDVWLKICINLSCPPTKLWLWSSIFIHDGFHTTKLMIASSFITRIRNQPAGTVTLTSLMPSTTPDPPHDLQWSCTRKIYTWNFKGRDQTHKTTQCMSTIRLWKTLMTRPDPLQVMHVDVNGGIVT